MQQAQQEATEAVTKAEMTDYSLPRPSQKEGSTPSPPPGGVDTLSRGEGSGEGMAIFIQIFSLDFR